MVVVVGVPVKWYWILGGIGVSATWRVVITVGAGKTGGVGGCSGVVLFGSRMAYMGFGVVGEGSGGVCAV